MQILLAQIASFAVVSAVFWRLIRHLVVKSTLSELPGPPSTSFWSGNFFQLFDRHAWSFHIDLAKKYGAAFRVNAFLGEQQLYVYDPVALNDIFKRQHTYELTDAFLALNDAVYGPSLPSSIGNAHRNQRKMLNPAFSMKHLRTLMPIFYPIAYQLRDVLTKQAREGKKDIDVMAWLSRAALECIGQGGIGYSFDALRETNVNHYNEAVKMLIPLGANLQIVQQLLPYAYKLVTPGWLRRKLFVDINPSKTLHRVRDIVDIMDETSRDIFEKKKTALSKGEDAILSQTGQGKDIMSVMIKANTEASEKEKLPESELLGQMNAFIFAGHDSTTSAVSRILHQLALYPDVQDRLRKEVVDARAAKGDMDLDEIMALPYLDAVVKETLRMYPPVSNVTRITKEDAVLPLAWPVKSADDKCEITSIPLKKNTKIIVSIFNANRDPRIWGPDGHEWKPERWLSPMPESVTNSRLPGVYAQMVTFIGGGRSCIGFKFAEMEIKLTLSVILETLIFTPGTNETYWNMSGTYSPTVKGSEDISPQLLLNVSSVETP